MKKYFLQSAWTAVMILMVAASLPAQFDDVYYDPDVDDPVAYSRYGSSSGSTTPAWSYYDEEGTTYYDDDSYGYYDDYDYYYTSRIRRFHRPYTGFGFYDPIYVSYNYYDPFFNDFYYYPGSSIYISFGNASYRDYRRWRRWDRWNQWNNWGYGGWGWSTWYHTPASYYYSYNNWYCPPSFNYWGGYHGYYGYSGYYNNYFNSCPLPVSYYNGITHTTVNVINQGGTRGTYYGPRVTGNTGSSPRGPVPKPGIAEQPVYRDGAQTDPVRDSEPAGAEPVRRDPAGPVVKSPDNGERTPVESPSPVRTEPGDGTVRGGTPADPVIRNDEKPSGTGGRPVFRPNEGGRKYEPYPTTRPGTRTEAPRPGSAEPQREKNDAGQRPQDKTPGAPSTREQGERPAYTPPVHRQDDKPSYNPPSRPQQDRPSYTPPARTEPQRGTEQRPAPPRHEESRSNDRPSSPPPPRTEPQRSNDRPAYSPPSRSNDSGRSSYSAPDRGSSSSGAGRSSSSSSGGGSRSSGGGGSSSSPRGGRG